MMKTIVTLCLLGSAAAFAPAPSTPRPATALMAKSKALPFLEAPPKLDGSMAGDVGFDPLGLSEIDDVGIDLYWMREAELKHGRVAMLAAAGVIFTTMVGSWPGWPASAGKCQMDVFWDVWEDKPNYFVSALVFISMAEAVSGVATTSGRESGLREPGDFMFNPLKFKVTDDLKLKEVKNGRLAMLATAGMIVQGLTTHESIFANMASK